MSDYDDDYGLKFDDLDSNTQVKTAVDFSEKMARNRYEDYDDTVKHVFDRVGKDEEFREKIFSSGDPAEALYKAGRKELEGPSLDELFGDAKY